MYRLVVKPEQIELERINLDKQQLHYLLRVLRLGDGDRFIVLDGIGRAWLAEIRGKIAKILKLLNVKTELPIRLSLITALPKGSGYEQILRCCTELGVSNFVPIISDRTIVKPKPNKLERWRKIVTEAVEQSERQIIPDVLEPLKFIEAIAQVRADANKYICVARGTTPTLFSSLQRQTRDEIVIATGCEGGWTENEVEKAIAIGFQPVSLGNRILRAITAPIVASSIVTAAIE